MTRLCHIDTIPDPGARGFETEQGALFAVKRDGEVFLYRNRCPHLGVELNWLEDQFLDLDNALIQCATHGALFLIDSGECVSGPCRGSALEAVAFSLSDGWIAVPQD